MPLMTLIFPLTREIMTTVRLVTGGVGSLFGFGLDACEDCKVCVTEGLLLLLHSGCTQAKVEFSRGEKLFITLEGEGGAPQGERSVEEEISVALLNALVEGLSVERGEHSTRISFGFGNP